MSYSLVFILPRLLGMGCIFTNFDFGPSGVRALPLAAGTNEGGHYFRYFSMSTSLNQLFSAMQINLFKSKI